MESTVLLPSLSLAVAVLALFLADVFWFFPLRAYSRLRRTGFVGPKPTFPLGNIGDMSGKATGAAVEPPGPGGISHDIHPTVLPHFARWRRAYGKVFVYWLGTEPFLYVADPRFLKQVTAGTMAKQWGKPNVFKADRRPMFGIGLLMSEGKTWASHRNIISPAFSAANLNSTIEMMVERTNSVINKWNGLISSGSNHIDVERDITRNASDIIAATCFGTDAGTREIFDKLLLLHRKIFEARRLVGVPLSRLFHLRHTVACAALGKDIDGLLLATLKSRGSASAGASRPERDLLGFLLAGEEKKLSDQEIVDNCKTFFFAGHDTTALAITWTLLLLAMHPEWQRALREEVAEATAAGKATLDSDVLAKLTKMDWVFKEVQRLYPSAPNTHRQTREDIRVGDAVIPRGTNIWIDTVGMHHDEELWGADAQEFKPERFRGSGTGGCRDRMGFLPFGFGGRVCVGRNLALLEYKVFLSLVIRRFELSVSPAYRHSPAIMLTLRPSSGLQLILQPING